MMETTYIKALFPIADQPVVYASYLNDRRYATQWSLYRGVVSQVEGVDLHDFEFLLELDPNVIGQGGSILKQRSRLLCDAALGPVRFVSEVAGTRLSLDFAGDEVRVVLPDGSRQTVARGGAEFLVEANMTGQQALVLARAHGLGRLDSEARFTAFVVNALLAVPYRTTPAPDLQATDGRWLRSSHDEELQIDSRGLLRVGRNPIQGSESRLEEPPPPLPDWHAGPVPGLDLARYRPPAGNFRLEDVKIPGPVTPLGGTVTVPNGEGPFPTVLFLSGTGTHDRHGMAGEVDLGTHEIVDYLADQGFLGLRYDTRGAGGTKLGEDALDQGLETVVADARAALAYLRSRSDVSLDKVFLIGHSQGGVVALRLATDQPDDVRGVVLLASTGRSIDQVLIDQTLTVGRRTGLADEQIQAQIKQLKEFVELVVSDKPWEPEQVPDQFFAASRNRRWMKEHLTTRPTDLIAKLRCPVLVFQGDKDFQVLADKDAVLLEQAAREAGVAVTLTIVPGLDHTFKAVDGEESTIQQYFDRSRHVDRGFLEQLAAGLRRLASG